VSVTSGNAPGMFGVRRVAPVSDRDPIIVRGLASILAAETGFGLVATCVDGSACMESMRDLSPDPCSAPPCR
jgi:hypothetical protein